MQQDRERVALTDAGLRAGLSYLTIRDKVMRHELKGGKDAGKWWVDAADLARFIREKNRAAKQAA